MNIFEQTINDWTASILTTEYKNEAWDSSEITGLIEQPPNPELGDYALPCFSFSKTLRRSPAVIASELADKLQKHLLPNAPFTHIQARGPYLNFTVSAVAVAEAVLPDIFHGNYFKEPSSLKREKVMIEYSQPNTHKGFHVGHLRNVALGDSLCRIYLYNGYDVVGANYIGDIGSHIAKCLWYLKNHNTEDPPENYPGEWLGELYANAVRKLEAAEGQEKISFQDELSQLLRKIDEKDEEIYQEWETTREWSLKDFHEIYEWLDVKFDHFFYESEVDEEGRKIVIEGEKNGIFKKSEGAIGIDLDEEGFGFFMLLKSDGNTLYSTKDLALARQKFDNFDVKRSIYVVGAEQTLHFKQVFATLKRMGYKQAEKCFHLPYALVMLPEGKMSSREGNVILFSQLRTKIIESIQSTHLEEHRKEWSRKELDETSQKIAVAAIKYGMLNQDSNKNIVFSMDDWLVSEGDTGTYLVYAYVRIRSIGRKISRKVSPDVDFSLLTHPNEKKLLRQLLDFNKTVFNAGEQFRPSLLARMLYEFSKDFSRAYNTCSVMHSETEHLKSARLLLFHCVAETLQQGLKLLGITPPERM
jgi:arginyl-tRNA synthetase|tara:strand:- start:5783 stop:7537 length:1755 start_codon:yes stop_codon:yes gene_type:complete